MDKDKKLSDHYVPEKDELEEEGGKQIDVKNREGIKAGRVDFPEVEEEYTTSSFKADVAQQAGRFSDQVLMDSPAAEAGAAGKNGLKGIIQSSKKRLSEKLKNRK